MPKTKYARKTLHKQRRKKKQQSLRRKKKQRSLRKKKNVRSSTRKNIKGGMTPLQEKALDSLINCDTLPKKKKKQEKLIQSVKDIDDFGHLIRMDRSDKSDPTISLKKYGATALTTAARKGNLEMVEFLIDNEANPNKQDHKDFIISHCKGGQSPLSAAAYNGNLNVVSFLIDQIPQVDINLRDINTHYTPLMNAVVQGGTGNNASQNHIDIIKKLVTRTEIELNAARFNNDTPLIVAARLYNLEIVKVLLKAGADVKLINKNDKDKDVDYHLFQYAPEESKTCELLKEAETATDMNLIVSNPKYNEGETYTPTSKPKDSNAELLENYFEDEEDPGDEN